MQGLYRARDRVFRPWKNGGGETAEVLTSPDGAGFDGFDWRLSTAKVASSGPFSAFPGVDRVLVVLEGGSMTLRISGAQATLAHGAPPFHFAGDQPCHADLAGEALLDFNVMVRRPLRAELRRGKLTVPDQPGLAEYALMLEANSVAEAYDIIDINLMSNQNFLACLGTESLMISIR